MELSSKISILLGIAGNSKILLLADLNMGLCLVAYLTILEAHALTASACTLETEGVGDVNILLWAAWVLLGIAGGATGDEGPLGVGDKITDVYALSHGNEVDVIGRIRP